MLISLLNSILRGRPTIKDLTLHNIKIGKILERFYKASSAFENKLVTYKVTASSAFENKLVTYKVTASSAFENVKVFG